MTLLHHAWLHSLTKLRTTNKRSAASVSLSDADASPQPAPQARSAQRCQARGSPAPQPPRRSRRLIRTAPHPELDLRERLPRRSPSTHAEHCPQRHRFHQASTLQRLIHNQTLLPPSGHRTPIAQRGSRALQTSPREDRRMCRKKSATGSAQQFCRRSIPIPMDRLARATMHRITRCNASGPASRAGLPATGPSLRSPSHPIRR